jgi:adenylylsulfate kinase
MVIAAVWSGLQIYREAESPHWPMQLKKSCTAFACAKRDPKGLYKKAHAGEITNMTGISAPYEEPEHSDLIIETDKLGLQQCVDEVIRFLLKQGLIMKAESSISY